MPGSLICGPETLYLEKKFPAIAKAVSKLKLRSTILDGEIVAVDKNGIPRFQLLQRFQKQPAAPTLYYLFDVLWSDGEDVTGKPILDRHAVLESILKPVTGIQLGSYIETEGIALFNRRLVRCYRDSEQIYHRLIAIKPDKFYKVELTHLIVTPTLVPSLLRDSERLYRPHDAPI